MKPYGRADSFRNTSSVELHDFCRRFARRVAQTPTGATYFSPGFSWQYGADFPIVLFGV